MTCVASQEITNTFLDRIYLAAYDNVPVDTDSTVFFTIEDMLLYNNFNLDFGPLHIGALYRFAVLLHTVLNDDANSGKAVCIYSSTDPKMRSNTACLLCCYMVLIQSWSPHQVLQPIAQISPPFIGFRDAGYSTADFEITIQDIVYAMWRAKERGMIDITNFNLEEYELYERVDQGDFNVISKDFIAFASPIQKRPQYLNEPFKKVLSFFQNNDVQLVVRLNSRLYDADEFTKRGMKHIDMIFDDGTCPTMDYVQKFIGAAETTINNGGKIAVHCKAGLGRTGCLIGAHLIYTHGFTANECIAYMRMIRPGMVVGPQQHWLYLHQNDFRDWRHTMVLDNRPDDFIGGLFSLCPYDEFKARMKQESRNRKLQQINSPATNIDSSFYTPIRRRKISGVLASKIHTAVPTESPGQPRKYLDSNENSEIHINNSDVELDSKEPLVDGVIENNLDSSPRRRTSENDWQVLKSASANQTQPIHLTKTTTTTTTRTISTTLSSSPQSSPTHTMKMQKTRVSSKGNIQKNGVHRVLSGGVRKSSGSGGSIRKPYNA